MVNNPLVRAKARQLLNVSLECERQRSPVLTDAARYARQRQNFLCEFGPERLTNTASRELLQRLPYNLANAQSMDYWLEFRNDAVFNCRLFGSIAGGSAAKFGTWQDKRTGCWRAHKAGTRLIQDIDEDTALQIVTVRRQEMLAAIAALQHFTQRPLQHLDPEAVQASVATAAPRWHGSAWLHKYLHLNFPELVTWSATKSYLQADLYRLGLDAGDFGLYAYDIRLIRFLSQLPALAQVPVFLQYRLTCGLGPRDHWCVRLPDDPALQETLLMDDYIALGPSQLANLAGLFSLTRQAEVKKAVEVAFKKAGIALPPKQLQDLIDLGYALKEGSIVALLSDSLTVVAVGKVDGHYRYVANAQYPHQLPVHWFHQQHFTLSLPVDFANRGLLRLAPDNPAVADMEASLLSHEKVSIFAGTPEARSAKPSLATWDSPPGVVGQLSEMLERKKQVILYGPPGTGKTYYAEQTALDIIARRNLRCLPSQLSERQKTWIQSQNGSCPYLAVCTFHPSYTYEDFIEGYRPEGKSFSLQPGIFRRLAAVAQTRPDKSFVLLIDEINRGNLPKIFGELITLLEPSKRGSITTLLPLSGDSFRVPANLYLIGTMNTADRSTLLLDTALRRRFAFKELLPDPALLQDSRIGDIALATWLCALNRRLREQLGRDSYNLQVGHAYFLDDGKPASTLQHIAAIVREDIWPLLQEYCYEEPQALAAILAADKGGIYNPQTAGLREELFATDREEELIQALNAIVTAADSKTTAYSRITEDLSQADFVALDDT